LTTHPFVPLSTYEEYPIEEMRQRLHDFYATVNKRRTVREFSDRPVPRDIIEDALRAAGTAPSGANLQPWHFSVVTGAATKSRIRVAAEIEEKEFYEHRASPEWLKALEPLGTDTNKPFLETAPYLIAVFLQKFGLLPDGSKVGIDWHRHRHTDHRLTYGRPGLSDAYAKPHEVSQRDTGSSVERATVPVTGDRLPG
jgi:nitroreductase